MADRRGTAARRAAGQRSIRRMAGPAESENATTRAIGRAKRLKAPEPDAEGHSPASQSLPCRIEAAGIAVTADPRGRVFAFTPAIRAMTGRPVMYVKPGCSYVRAAREPPWHRPRDTV